MDLFYCIWQAIGVVEMKKIALSSLILLFLCFGLFSASCGYSFSSKGVSLKAADYDGVAFSLIFDPFEKGIGRIEAGLVVGSNSATGYGINEYKLSLSTILFSVLNPVDLLFTNKMLYRPEVETFILFNPKFNHSYGVRLSPFHFEDPHFRFDYFSPFILFDTEFKNNGWGIEVIKISYMF